MRCLQLSTTTTPPRYSWTLDTLPRSSRLALGSLGTAERRPRGRRASRAFSSMDLLDDLDAENVTPGFLRSELTRWVDGEPLRATKPPCKWWESSRHRAHRAIGGRRGPHSTSRSPRCVALARPAPGALPYLSLSAPVAPHLRNTTPSQEEVDRPRRHLARDARLSAQDTVAPDRAPRARATARGNGGPQRAKAKTRDPPRQPQDPSLLAQPSA